MGWLQFHLAQKTCMSLTTIECTPFIPRTRIRFAPPRLGIAASEDLWLACSVAVARVVQALGNARVDLAEWTFIQEENVVDEPARNAQRERNADFAVEIAGSERLALRSER